MMKKIVLGGLALSLAAVGSGCGREAGNQGSDVLIFGGREATDADAALKHTVALLDRNFETFCSGSLISPIHILTAAHCFENSAKSLPVYVAFGNRSAGETVKLNSLRVVEAVTVHKGFLKDIEKPEVLRAVIEDGKVVNDVAVLQLSKPAPEGFLPVRRPGGVAIPVGTTLTLAGFGITKLDPLTAFARKRQQAQLSGKEHDGSGDPTPEELAALMAEANNYKPDSGTLRVAESIMQEQLAAKEMVISGGNAGVCSGDSGGPAFAEATIPGEDGPVLLQVGIASRSDCQQLAFHTDVGQFGDWIRRAALAQIAASESGVPVPMLSELE